MSFHEFLCLFKFLKFYNFVLLLPFFHVINIVFESLLNFSVCFLISLILEIMILRDLFIFRWFFNTCSFNKETLNANIMMLSNLLKTLLSDWWRIMTHYGFKIRFIDTIRSKIYIFICILIQIIGNLHSFLKSWRLHETVN